MDQRLSLVTLGVADVARARRFYEALGWRASSASQPEIAFFQLNGLALALYGQTALSADTAMPAPPRPGGITLAINMSSQEQVDATIAEAVKAGASLLKAAAPTPWGGYVGYFADPDGHPWEIAWVPMFELDAQGNLVLPA